MVLFQGVSPRAMTDDGNQGFGEECFSLEPSSGNPPGALWLYLAMRSL